MEEQNIQDQKFRCTVCGFESNGPGECPTDDEVLQRVCDCGSEKYSLECCEVDSGSSDEQAIEAEVKAEDLEERVSEAEIEEEEEA